MEEEEEGQYIAYSNYSPALCTGGGGVGVGCVRVCFVLLQTLGVVAAAVVQISCVR